MNLTIPRAIVLAAVIFVAGAFFASDNIWLALTAVGTVSAVVYAIFQQTILAHWNRPVLEMSFFEPDPPHLRQTPATNIQTGERVGTLYPLSIRLQNKGKTIAKNARVLITNMGTISEGEWETQANWVAPYILWALDEPAMLSGQPTGDRDLVPERPYIFNLGQLGTRFPDTFKLRVVSMPGGQLVDYPAGEYCFEVTAFAEGADPRKKYVHVQWDGQCTEDFETVKGRIRVYLLDRSPW